MKHLYAALAALFLAGTAHAQQITQNGSCPAGASCTVSGTWTFSADQNFGNLTVTGTLTAPALNFPLAMASATASTNYSIFGGL